MIQLVYIQTCNCWSQDVKKIPVIVAYKIGHSLQKLGASFNCVHL